MLDSTQSACGRALENAVEKLRFRSDDIAVRRNESLDFMY